LLLLAGTPSGLPRNDDGAYLRMVSLWAEQGRPVMIGWNEMTLLGHLLPGVLVRVAGATSIASLQLLTAFEAALISCLLCWLCRRRRLPAAAAVMIALSWMASPLVLISACSFMTEISIAFWTTCWLVLFAAWLREARPLYATGWMLAAVGACSVRQPGLVLPLAAAAAALALPRERRRQLVGLATLTLVADIGLLWYRSALPLATIRPLSSFWAGRSLPEHLWSMAGNAAEALTTLGLLLLPLVVLTWQGRLRSFTPPVIFTAATAAVLLLARGSLIPFWNNLVTAAGVLPDTLPWHTMPAPVSVLPVALRFVLTLCGLLSLAVLVAMVKRLPWLSDPLVLACGIAGAGYLAAICMPVYPFDRYLVPLLPLVVALVAMTVKHDRWRWRWPAVLLLVVCCLLAVLPVRHLQRRQRTLWQVAEQVAAAGIEPGAIDGGFEWNMWYQPIPFEPQSTRPRSECTRWYEHYPFTRLQPVRRLWIGPVPAGWEVLSEHTIPGGQQVLVLAPTSEARLRPSRHAVGLGQLSRFDSLGGMGSESSLR
jgi:hypothetical protein